MKNANIKYYPGVLYSNIRRTQSTYPGGSNPTAQINYFAQDRLFPAIGLDLPR